MLGTMILVAPLQAQQGDREDEPQSARPAHLNPPASPALTPQQALASFHLAEPDLKLELFACEPMIQDPIAMSFDEAGRAWVVEMRGFMPDLEGSGEMEPVGRVSVLEDTDDDGRADRSTVFLDGLILPRAVAPAHGGALIADHDRLLFARDTDGDGRADDVQVVDEAYAEDGNVEHRANGLCRAMDNWYYNARSTKRYRFVDGRWIWQRTERRGQWGISQDDFGRLYYNYNWDQLRTDTASPNALMRHPHHEPTTGSNAAVALSQRVFPVRMGTGVNRGYRPGVLDERGYLTQFASACGPLIYRGDALGADWVGNAMVCGTGANLVKRNRITQTGLNLSAVDVYPDRELLASTDERFRPVNLANGPDGALYIVDMYRGVIQHRAFMTTYLHRESEERRLAVPVHMGRIYRLTRQGTTKRTRCDLASAANQDLIAALQHANGWVRDTAQRLLVGRADRSVVPALIQLAQSDKDPRTRTHALWVIEALGSSDLQAFLPLLDDPSVSLVAQAVRVMTRLAGDQKAMLFDALNQHLATAPIEVRLEIMLPLA